MPQAPPADATPEFCGVVTKGALSVFEEVTSDALRAAAAGVADGAAGAKDKLAKLLAPLEAESPCFWTNYQIPGSWTPGMQHFAERKEPICTHDPKVGTRPSRLHCTALPCTALRYPALHCASLHCTVLLCTALCYPALRCATLHCTALPCTALRYPALLCATLHGSALPCTALCYPALYCATLHCTALPCTALHFLPRLPRLPRLAGLLCRIAMAA